MIGFSEGFHDSAVACVRDGHIVFATHGERISRQKHDKRLPLEAAAIAQASNLTDNVISFYERPLKKKIRQYFAGQKAWRQPRDLCMKPTHYCEHHMSHAAAAFQTSVFDEAACVVVDSIGEFDCSSIWTAKMVNGRAEYKKVWNMRYPKSIGLWYSALTKWAGLKPLDEEYIFMGMAAYGKPTHVDEVHALLDKNNHRGIKDLHGAPHDIAKSAEVILEHELMNIFNIAKTYSNNICYGGGVALNCVINTKLREMCNLWIMPNPGDAGGALGAALIPYGEKVQFTPYLGYNIRRPIDPNEIVAKLLSEGIVGVASGRAEFGPRALGNRSLLADPRKISTKSHVNSIKRRQKFRPFAPAILEEYANEYFEMPAHSRYMQYVYQCKRPHDIPAVLHVDNTARVQTVPETSDSILRDILEVWYEHTGCPVLLNTSLNVRGKPMVNDVVDALNFSSKYHIDVY